MQWQWRACACCHHCRYQPAGLRTWEVPASGCPIQQPMRKNIFFHTAANTQQTGLLIHPSSGKRLGFGAFVLVLEQWSQKKIFYYDEGNSNSLKQSHNPALAVDFTSYLCKNVHYFLLQSSCFVLFFSHT